MSLALICFAQSYYCLYKALVLDWSLANYGFYLGMYDWHMKVCTNVSKSVGDLGITFILQKPKRSITYHRSTARDNCGKYNLFLVSSLSGV